MSAASKVLDRLLQKQEKLTEDEQFEVMEAVSDVFFEDEGRAFSARATLSQMWVDGLLPFEP